jgi:hypothetical protein
MRWIVVALLAIHGLIHAMGFLKAYRLAELPQLVQPIGRTTGLLWLASGVLVVATAACLVFAPRISWMVGAAALVASQAVIATSWSDAKFGTLGNVVLLLAVVYGFLSQGPLSYRAEYDRLLDAELARPPVEGLVTEADLARLPAPVARYVRASGAAGQPRVVNFRASIRGRIRSGPHERWMPFSGEQFDRFGDNSARLFFIDASMLGLPVDVLHVFRGAAATMRAKAGSLVPVVNASGPEMNRSETVTLFNDLCILAPAALVDPAIEWVPVDDHTAAAVFTRGPNVTRAVLSFGPTGELVDFVSDDRLRSSPDGRTFTVQRWSTPVGTVRTFGTRRVSTKGEARWHAPAPEGEFAYLEFELVGIAYNVRTR